MPQASLQFSVISEKIQTPLTELQFPKVSTTDLLPHTKIRSHHENAGGVRGAGRSVSAPVSLVSFGASSRPLAIFLSLLIHGVPQHWSAGASSDAQKKASWAVPTAAATALVTGGTWMAQSLSWARSWSCQPAGLPDLALSARSVARPRHLSHKEGRDLERKTIRENRLDLRYVGLKGLNLYCHYEI